VHKRNSCMNNCNSQFQEVSDKLKSRVLLKIPHICQRFYFCIEFRMKPCIRFTSVAISAAYLSLKVVVKQNVGGFDVTMDDAGMTIFMQVCKPSCRSKGNSQSCCPVHDKSSLLAYRNQNTNKTPMNPSHT
jgi:hypothetical protein